MRKALFFVLFVISPIIVKAQKLGIQLGADYESPVAQFGNTYKPVPAYQMDVLLFTENDHTINFSLGYRNFKPKADIFYYSTADGEGGTATFSDYKAISAYVGYMHNFSLSEVFKLGLGFNFGIYESTYSRSSQDNYQIYNGSFGDQNLYLAAKTGLAYDVSERMRINLQAKYNGFSPTGSNNSQMAAFNNHIGTVNQTWSAGLSIAYRFELNLF